MPMTKNKKMLLMLAKGGTSQSDIARALHVSKRDVSAAARVVREHGLTFDAISMMDASAVDELFFPKKERAVDESYHQPDLEAYVERKKRNNKIPIRYFWMEYCDEALGAGKCAYAYQTFCEKLAAVAERMGATRHFEHEPGEKCYVDWAGDAAYLTDKVTGATAKVYLLVVSLPFSSKLWAEGFCDMKQRSWQDGHAHAFEYFGGVPRILVPDNAATATDRSASASRVTLVNAEYERFAEHYGAAVLPARVRKPRDKSTGESAVDLVEKWIIGPAREMRFYTLEEFNEFCAEKVDWLNARPFSAKDGSRDELYEQEERGHMSPLPAERYEMCEWRVAKVSPDYHVTIDYMHYSVPCGLIGKEVDVRLSAGAVVIMHGGEAVARHPRLRGRKGQYHTVVDHMPDNHRNQLSPWSRERFTSWAEKVGPETRRAIERLQESRAVVEQSFVACRNILGLAKTYSPALLERACGRMNATGAVPSYTACKNAILAEKATEVQARAGKGVAQPGAGKVVDRAKRAGRLRGADAYRRGGE